MAKQVGHRASQNGPYLETLRFVWKGSDTPASPHRSTLPAGSVSPPVLCLARAAGGGRSTSAAESNTSTLRAFWPHAAHRWAATNTARPPIASPQSPRSRAPKAPHPIPRRLATEQVLAPRAARRRRPIRRPYSGPALPHSQLTPPPASNAPSPRPASRSLDPQRSPQLRFTGPHLPRSCRSRLRSSPLMLAGAESQFRPGRSHMRKILV